MTRSAQYAPARAMAAASCTRPVTPVVTPLPPPVPLAGFTTQGRRTSRRKDAAAA